MRNLLRKIIFSVFGYKVTVEGSNDGENWEYIATQRVKPNKEYKLPNEKAYKHYRFKGIVPFPLWVRDKLLSIKEKSRSNF